MASAPLSNRNDYFMEIGRVCVFFYLFLSFSFILSTIVAHQWQPISGPLASKIPSGSFEPQGKNIKTKVIFYLCDPNWSGARDKDSVSDDYTIKRYWKGKKKKKKTAMRVLSDINPLLSGRLTESRSRERFVVIISRWTDSIQHLFGVAFLSRHSRAHLRV